MTKPRIPWKVVWKEFDGICEVDDPDWSEQQRLISLIVGGHIAPWTVDWKALWEEFQYEFEEKMGDLSVPPWGNFQQLLIQRLVRKHLQEPKK